MHAARVSSREPLTDPQPLDASLQVRNNEILPVLDPRLRGRIKTQEFFQDLEGWEPILGQMPLRASDFCQIQGAKSRIP